MIRTLDDYNFNGKRTLVRVDYNVPLDEKLEITDDKRILATLPTLKKILTDGGMPILMSHLGRPNGMRVATMSLRPVAEHLAKLLDCPVHFADDCNTDIARNTVGKSNFGEVVLLENLRFYKEEEENDPEFAENLAALGDVYVNDAFGTAHRAHASTAAVAKQFEDRLAGKLIEKELEYLETAVNQPERPFTAIIGGAKVSGKIDVIENLFSKCENVLIGGGMVFTFLKAQGKEVGKSLIEADKLDLARKILSDAKANNVNLVLPTDVVVAKEFNNDTEFRTVSIDEIPTEMMGLDIGIETTKHYQSIIEDSKTVLWNGPMGVFEMENFARGTFGVANALATATNNGANTIVGGGDSVAAIRKLGFEDKVSHISTGGGASLEFLEGKKLPGIEALR